MGAQRVDQTSVVVLLNGDVIFSQAFGEPRSFHVLLRQFSQHFHGQCSLRSLLNNGFGPV
jgi:hypothetical protein